MARDSDDREGESPSPMEPRLGGCSTARRPVAAVNKLFLRRSVFVKRFTHEMTPHRSAGSQARTTRSAAAHRTSIASPAGTCDPNRRSDRIRGDGPPSQNALLLKIHGPLGPLAITHRTGKRRDSATGRRFDSIWINGIRPSPASTNFTMQASLPEATMPSSSPTWLSPSTTPARLCLIAQERRSARSTDGSM